MAEIRRIALSTGGGDAPGLNAVIRAAVLAALRRGWEVAGIRRGFDGLLAGEDLIPLDGQAVRGITHLGGTILGTTNRGNPFDWPVQQPDGSVRTVDRSGELVEEIRRRGIDALITIGGDGTLHIANHLSKLGLPVVGVPKTIDNDLAVTQVTFGFHTAVQTATDAIDKLHSTAESHERVMVVEVMGRTAGWIALHAGLSATADVVIEVLSPLTERYDRGRKWEHYRQIPSLAEYLLVAQDQPRVEHYLRQEGGFWIFSEASTLEGSVELASIGCTLALRDVYDRVF